MDGLAGIDIGADGVRIGSLSKQSLSLTKNIFGGYALGQFRHCLEQFLINGARKRKIDPGHKEVESDG